MERLTYFNSFGDGDGCWQIEGADNVLCSEVCKDQGDSGCKDCPLAKSFDRLAAYEDTGLTPEQIKSIVESGAKFCEAYDAVDTEIGFAHLKELMNAEAEGRLLVLETAPRDSYKGLKRKYIVFKSDSGEPVENCFVLRPDKDHAAKIALEAYANTTDNKTLADDITRWIGDSGKVLVLPCKVGDTIFLLYEKQIHELRVQGISVSVSGKDTILHFGGYPVTNVWGSGLGRTYFLTRAAAEAALEQEADNA